jgi:hypothetical protein
MLLGTTYLWHRHPVQKTWYSAIVLAAKMCTTSHEHSMYIGFLRVRGSTHIFFSIPPICQLERLTIDLFNLWVWQCLRISSITLTPNKVLFLHISCHQSRSYRCILFPVNSYSQSYNYYCEACYYFYNGIKCAQYLLALVAWILSLWACYKTFFLGTNCK